jgi:phosphate transport system substrate-binding protein
MDKTKVAILILCLGLLVFFSSPPVSEAQESKPSLRVRGATTVASLVDPWVGEFEAKVPGVRVVVYGSTHGDGLRALLDGSADVAMTARGLSSDEQRTAERKGLKLVEHRICNDALAIIVNKENPVSELSLDQLSKVFGGSYTNWSQVGGADELIVVVTLPADSGMASFLSKDVLKTRFASTAIVEKAPREVVPLVQSRKGAISFCRTDLALKGSASNRIKTPAIKKDDTSAAVALTKGAVEDGTFPIIRPLGLCYDSANAPTAAKEFAEFCRMKHNHTSQ